MRLAASRAPYRTRDTGTTSEPSGSAPIWLWLSPWLLLVGVGCCCLFVVGWLAGWLAVVDSGCLLESLLRQARSVYRAAMVPVHPQPIFQLAFRRAVVQSANCAPFHLRHGNMTTATDFHSPGSVGIAVHCRIYILHACKRLAVSRAILSTACAV